MYLNLYLCPSFLFLLLKVNPSSCFVDPFCSYLLMTYKNTGKLETDRNFFKVTKGVTFSYFCHLKNGHPDENRCTRDWRKSLCPAKGTECEWAEQPSDPDAGYFGTCKRGRERKQGWVRAYNCSVALRNSETYL